MRLGFQPQQRFSNLSMRWHHLERRDTQISEPYPPRAANSVGLRVRPGFNIPRKLAGDANAAGSWTTLGGAPSWRL